MYIKDSLSPFVSLMTEYTTSDQEEMWLAVDTPGRKKMMIALIYRPPSGNCRLFEDRLENTLKALNGLCNFLKT